MTLFQLAFVPLLLAVAGSIFISTLRNSRPRLGGFAWSAVWALGALLVAYPGLTSVAARWLGIGRGADLLLYVVTIAGLAGGLSLYARFRRLEILMTEIIRREALRTATRSGFAPTATGPHNEAADVVRDSAPDSHPGAHVNWRNPRSWVGTGVTPMHARHD